MIQYLQELSDRYQWIKLTHIAVLLIVAASVSYFFAGSAAMQNEPFDFAPTFTVINLMATIFIYGVPFTLGAVILWNTKLAHKNLTDVGIAARNVKRVYLERLLISAMISFLYMTGVCFVGYLLNGAEIVYLPAILLSAFVVVFMLNAFIFMLALFVDSPLFTVFCATAIFSYLSFVFGWAPLSALNEAALYAPYHLFRYLAIALTGYEFSSSQAMEYYVGLSVGPVFLIGPIVVWGLLSLISVYGALHIMQREVTRWRQELGTWETLADEKRGLSVSRSLVDVRNRRKMLAVGIVLLVVAMGAYNLYTTPLNNQIPEDLVLYKSPDGGEIIALGSWRYGVVNVSSTQTAQADGWTFDVTILEWGAYAGRDGLDVKRGLVVLSLADFEAMNETERASTISGTSHGFTPENPSSGEGAVLALEGANTYLWALRITDSANVNATYPIVVSVDIYLQSM